MIWAVLGTAALFAIYGLMASKCNCKEDSRCAGCPFEKGVHDDHST